MDEKIFAENGNSTSDQNTKENKDHGCSIDTINLEALKIHYSHNKVKCSDEGKNKNFDKSEGENSLNKNKEQCTTSVIKDTSRKSFGKDKEHDRVKKCGETDKSHSTSKYYDIEPKSTFKDQESKVYRGMFRDNDDIRDETYHERSKSKILYLRNFHNWMKSMLIGEYVQKVKDKKNYNEPILAHDMCCGRGGDLLKWWNNHISHLICSDISSTELQHCKARYDKRINQTSNSNNNFTIEYIAADCSRVCLREKYIDPSMKLDIVSCQFRLHYTFASLAQAECMMQNAAECLQLGGYFIGIIPDANELLARVHKSDTNSFGNDIYKITFECDTTTPPLFGAKYKYYLESRVECSEFVTHFPLLEKLATKYGLKLVKKEKFSNFYERNKVKGGKLLNIIYGLETYPSQKVQLNSTAEDYEHAKFFVESQGEDIRIGTLSKSEWEVTTLYLTFAFEKVEDPLNADGGVTVFDI